MDVEFDRVRHLFVCSGLKSPKVRRNRALEHASLMKDFDYGGKAEILSVDYGSIQGRAIPEKEHLFWRTFAKSRTNLTRDAITLIIGKISDGKVEEDAATEQKLEKSTMWYR